MKTREQIFGEMLKKIFYDYIHVGVYEPCWWVIIPTPRDYHRIQLTLSWKYGNATKDFNDRRLSKTIRRNYKRYDRADYYRRKNENNDLHIYWRNIENVQNRT